MKSMIRLLFTLLLIAPVTAFAQITIDESILTDNFGITRTVISFETSDGAGLDAIVAASGENQIWDFSELVYTDSSTFVESYLSLPADVPGSDRPEFSDATLVQMSSIEEDGDMLTVYVFASLNNGNYIVYGDTFIGDDDEDGTTDTLYTFNDPPSLDIIFPVAYENTWRDSTTTVIEGFPAFGYTIEENVVDGWGTLITPAGERPALRVKNTYMSYSTTPPLLLSTDISYQFVTTDLAFFADIEVDEDGTPLYAGYSMAFEDMSTANESDDLGIPASFKLAQNYPNPFNPATQIAYTLPASSEVRLTVFTVTGQEVETLVDATQAAGSYEVNFDASELASGLYLYRLETGQYTETRLMSLIK